MEQQEQTAEPVDIDAQAETAVEKDDRLCDLKQQKARAKSAFTRAKNHLLHLLDDQDMPSRREVKESRKKLITVQEKLIDNLSALSDEYSDLKNRQKITGEIEKIDLEFAEAQDKAQEFFDSRRDESSSVLSNVSTVVKQKQIMQIKARQSAECLRHEAMAKEKMINEMKSKWDEELAYRKRELDEEMTEINRQLLSAETDAMIKSTELENTLNLELGIDPILGNPCAKEPADENKHHVSFEPNVHDRLLSTSHLESSAVNIGHDLWKQLKRVSIPVFTGDIKTYESWKAAFNACIDQAPATPEYKLLQLRQYISGDALKAIESLGHSATAYQAAKDRLERKYGGNRRKMAIYIEQLENFRTMRPGNSVDMDKFADLLDVTVINLKESGNEDELRSGSLYSLLQRKMPESMLSRYHRWIHETNTNESVESLRCWVNKEAEFQTIAHETITGIMTDTRTSNNTTRKQEKTRTLFSNNSSNHRVCTLCDGNHGIWACKQFKDMNIQQRWDCAKIKNLCYRCLGDNHRGRDCTRSRVCGLSGCKYNHNRLLHENKSVQAPTENPPTTTMVTKTPKQFIALRTIPVILKNGLRKITVNALLDDGSSQTYINSDIAGELGLQGKFEKVKVSVLNGKIDVFDTMPVSVGLESIDGKVNVKVNALTTDNVTGNMHVTDWNTVKSKWNHLKDINFPRYKSKQVVDILIGLDCADLHFAIKEVRGGTGEPIARLTPLGWTCIGNPEIRQHQTHSVHFARTYHVRGGTELDELNCTLKRFWETEHYGIENDVPILTPKEKQAVNTVELGVKIIDGRYQIPIPWKAERVKLPDNYDMAVRRLECTEKRLLKNPDIAASYSSTINQYAQKGYIRKVDEQEKKPIEKWYLPHFAIVKPDRSTTKTRVVFDASAKMNDVCLNDVIHQGPKLQQDLYKVLLRFRRNPVALVCDIAEMYLRIGINPDDRPFHRFLWRELDQTKRPDEYEFNRVVFGVNASPFLAQFVSQIHARKFAEEFPLASETVLKSTYMDDSMDSVTDDIQGLELYRQLSELWGRAGMHARKWLSNSTTVLNSIPIKDRSSEIILENNPLPTIKTLGILWVAEEDVFTFRCTPPLTDFKVTKRNILSKIATVFDPLGFLSPYIIRAKVLIQELWAAGIDWDDDLDEITKTKVSKWFEELDYMTSIKVPRCLQVHSNKLLSSLTLHVFVDASQDAYATVIYCRYTYQDGNVHVGFVASKTRVAPLTVVSIPRLELMAAVIGLRLASTTSKVMEIPMKEVTFWSDSSNVLYWIRGRSRSRQFKPFVSNRVGEIQGVTDPSQWRHVPTKENPADVATRGSNVRILAENQLWWQGPAFLVKEETNWPINKFETCASNNERKPGKIHTMITHAPWRLDPTRFSSWVSLIRLHAWVCRFVNNCRLPLDKRNRGELSPEEVSDAEINIIKTAQRDGFSAEFKLLSCGKILKIDSKIIGLQPKIDDDGLMRSDGRLKFAEFLPYDVRYPIILPRKNWVTKLIVKHHHEKGFHVSGTVPIIYIIFTFLTLLDCVWTRRN